jgi:hypothetical protein
MIDLVAAIIAVIGGLIWLFGAAMLIGAVVSVVRPDHRNPIAPLDSMVRAPFEHPAG